MGKISPCFVLAYLERRGIIYPVLNLLSAGRRKSSSLIPAQPTPPKKSPATPVHNSSTSPGSATPAKKTGASTTSQLKRPGSSFSTPMKLSPMLSPLSLRQSPMPTPARKMAFTSIAFLSSSASAFVIAAIYTQAGICVSFAMAKLAMQRTTGCIPLFIPAIMAERH